MSALGREAAVPSAEARKRSRIALLVAPIAPLAIVFWVLSNVSGLQDRLSFNLIFFVGPVATSGLAMCRSGVEAYAEALCQRRGEPIKFDGIRLLTPGYFRFHGETASWPGWVSGALTLGAVSALAAGWVFLWVNGLVFGAIDVITRAL